VTQTVEAIYERGVLRPLKPLEGLAENSRVSVSVEAPVTLPGNWRECIGTLPDEDAREMLLAIEEAFEQVDPRDWQ
jgi:predicted DNA-binding antitoxin AbrB/MazE fold protein